MDDFAFDPSTIKTSSKSNDPVDFPFTPGQKPLQTKIINRRSGHVKNWSFSALKTFEKCNYETFLKSVQKIPQTAGEAAERGNIIHDLAENYVNGTLETLPAELQKMTDDFIELRRLYVEGKVILEEEWAFTDDWDITEWKAQDTWLRLKLDVMIQQSETCAVIIDHKTGKRFGNEMKHGEQLMLYAIASFLRYPNLEFIEVCNWYLDHNEKLSRTYTREEAMLFVNTWTNRATTMTTTTEFYPSPSKYNCKWCFYKDSGDCKWAE